MVVRRPQVWGRVTLEKAGSRVRIHASLEVYGALFDTPAGVIDARDAPKKVEFVLEKPLGYHPPHASPLPRISEEPYSLIDYSIVYVHDPSIRVAQSPCDSTTVLTSTGYTMVDCLSYPLLALGENVACNMLDCCYPFTPKTEPFKSIVELEYEMLKRGSMYAHYASIVAACVSGSCEVLNRMWVERRHPRLAIAIREWANTLGVSLEHVEPPAIQVDRLLFKTSHPVAYVTCEDGKVVEEVVSPGEWRPGDACYVSLVCRYCLEPRS